MSELQTKLDMRPRDGDKLPDMTFEQVMEAPHDVFCTNEPTCPKCGHAEECWTEYREFTTNAEVTVAIECGECGEMYACQLETKWEFTSVPLEVPEAS